MKNPVFRSRSVKTVLSLLLAAMLLMLTACGTKTADNVLQDDDGSEPEIVEAPDKDYIDRTLLKTLTKQDTFALKVTDKSIQKQEGTSGDQIKVTIANSGKTRATEITLYFVGYTEGRELINWRDHGVMFAPENDPFLCSCIPAGGFSVAAGKTNEVSVPVEDVDDFAGFEAIVASYKTDDGVKYINDTALEWEEQYARGRYRLLAETDAVDVTASASQVRLNADVMRQIKTNDTFPVQVTRKALLKKLKSVPTSKDNCIMTVENRTSERISEVAVYAAAYTKDGALIKFPDRGYNGAWRVTSDIEPGKTVNQHFAVNDVDEIAGMFMVVASYKTADGEVHENPAVSDWEQVFLLAVNDVITIG